MCCVRDFPAEAARSPASLARGSAPSPHARLDGARSRCGLTVEDWQGDEMLRDSVLESCYLNSLEKYRSDVESNNNEESAMKIVAIVAVTKSVLFFSQFDYVELRPALSSHLNRRS